MRIRTTTFAASFAWLLALASTLAIGCASASHDGDGDGRTDAVDLEGAPIETLATTAPDAGGFRGTPCIEGGVVYQPRYIVRRPTKEDPSFDPAGFRIRFPTPWVTAGSTVPDVFHYEHGLSVRAPTIGKFGSPQLGAHQFEYRVHDLVPTANGGFVQDRSGTEWFFVGFSDQNYSSASGWVSAPGLEFTQAPVSAELGHCFYVMDRVPQAPTEYVWTGELWEAGDEHDPRNHPW
jgi:hypothetical protein